MDWTKKKILVTGAGGFIGSHLVEKLESMGAEVRAFLRYTSTGNLGNLSLLENYKDIDVFYGDLKDPFAVKQSMKDIDIIFHLASLISIPYSYINPRENFDNNVNFILNILEAAKELGTEFVVHTSSSEVYGSAQFIPITENHPLVGQSPYSASKISADKVAESYYLSFDSPVSILRPFNTFGPRQSSRAVIPTMIIQLLKGMNLELGDITTTRDFLFVEDTVRGFINMVEHGSKSVGKTIQIGTSKEITIKEVAELLIEEINPKAIITQKKEKIRPSKSEIRRLCADYSLANELINWRPHYTLQQGLELTIKWFKDNIKNYALKTAFI